MWYEWVFFFTAHKKIDALYRFIGERFKGLFGDNNEDEQETPSGHFYDAIRQRQEQRILQVARIATEKGTTISEIGNLDIYTYYLYLEDIINKSQNEAMN